MASTRKKHLAYIILFTIAIALFVCRELVVVYLTPLLQTQFPAFSENQASLVVEIVVAILLVPSAIDILYVHFFLERKFGLRTPT